MAKITIIGAGNVAYHLAQRFHTRGHKIEQVFSKRYENAEKLAHLVQSNPTNNLKDINNKADIYILAVKDDAIVEVAKKMRRFPNKIIAHTSGTVPSTIFSPHFRNHGVFYPLQTFSKQYPANFETLPFCIFGSNISTQKKLTRLAKSICPNVYLIDDQQRSTLHVAAVIVNNFSNFLFGMGKDICQKENVPFDILKPLILETALKIQQHNPSDVQTGPAARGDQKTIEKHLDFLEKNPVYQELYKHLSQAISRKYE